MDSELPKPDLHWLRARRLPACNLGGDKGGLFPPPRSSGPLRTDWQRHVLASSGYLQLGMLDDAALALEEIEPEDKTRTEVLGARIALYTAKKMGHGRSGRQSSRKG